MEDLPAEAPVAQQAVHIRIGCAAPVAVLLPLEHRRLRADGVIGRIGVLHELRVARIKVDRTGVGIDLHDGLGVHLRF